MDIWRKHWYDVGAVIAVLTLVLLFISKTDLYRFDFLMWGSFASVLLHQFEEYRYPGYFPGMFNKVMFNSDLPDRFPLNTQSSLIINMGGWGLYFLAALLAQKAIWLCIVSMLVSVGNFVIHTFVFNIKGKTFYNPGMVTSILLFLPITGYFFYYVTSEKMVTLNDFLIGIPIGMIANALVIKLVNHYKNTETPYVFEKRQVR
ncbi:HXXEE domain-containing protein [Fulvivirga sp. 29W222]|uniref:HXXEE domain-containing protein n=1 Tax=Fulvivirga marina TaxID=2494733 RepID=A0A937FWK8_9BACT|nr:HXXEE domain-containing protein [Fulvivirga marina]MBL6445992.1 HXXEE domain-containing protein [Fulvivirga marina]